MATVVEQAEGKQQGLKLELTRVIKASKQRVFDAWTRPEFVRQWFGTGKVCSAIEMLPHAGGTYMIEMTGPSCSDEGGADEIRTWRVTGRYVKVEPYDLLAFTWSWGPVDETLVTVALRDVDGGTEIKLTHERLQTEALRDLHQHGWEISLDNLVRFAEAE